MQSGGEGSQASTLPSDLEREKRLEAKVAIDLLKLLGPTFTQWSISHNAAVDIITKDRSALVLMGYKLEKPFLPCMPGLEGGTAREQAEEAYGVLAK